MLAHVLDALGGAGAERLAVVIALAIGLERQPPPVARPDREAAVPLEREHAQPACPRQLIGRCPRLIALLNADREVTAIGRDPTTS